MTLRERCPECGMPTIPYNSHARYEDMLCDQCYERAEKEPIERPGKVYGP